MALNLGKDNNVFPKEGLQIVGASGERVDVIRARIQSVSFFNSSTAYGHGESFTVANSSDATEYTDSGSTRTDIKDWGSFTFDTEKTGITSSLGVKLDLECKRDAVNGLIYLEQDGTTDLDSLNTGTSGTYHAETLSGGSITSGSFSIKTVVNAQSGTTYIKNQVLSLIHTAQKTTLNNTDFSTTSRMFIKSVTLPTGCEIRLNDDPESVLNNDSGASLTIDYSASPVHFTKIEILAGSPRFVFVEATTG